MSQFSTDVDNLNLTIILHPALSPNGRGWDLRFKTRLKASDRAKEGFYVRGNKIEKFHETFQSTMDHIYVILRKMKK